MKRITLICFLVGLFLWIPLLSGCDEECAHETLTQTVIAPTCDQEGYTVNTCTKCGFYYHTDYQFPTGHTITQTPVAATCDTHGYTLNHCKNCDVSYQSALTDPLGHKLSETVVEPTCNKQGYTETACSVCDWVAQSDFTAPTGHSFTTALTYPTRPRAGSVTRSCTCGYTYTNALMYSDVFSGAAVDQQSVLAKGVDVSLWQHKTDANGNYLPLDWGAIKNAGFDFAILKAGSTPRTVEKDGQQIPMGGIDPVFEQNYLAAKAAGLELGVYFYTYATTREQVEADAELLLSWLDDKQLEYPVYLDMEDPSLVDLGKETLTDFCVTFLTILQENGYYGALYSNPDWLTYKLNGEALKSAFDVWYARYPLSNPVIPTNSFTWNTDVYGVQMGMWQYTCHGSVPGIDPEIEFDFNYAYRDYPSIIKRFGYNGYKPIL